MKRFVLRFGALLLALVTVAGCATTAAPSSTVVPPRKTDGDFVLTSERNDFVPALSLDYSPFEAAMTQIPAERYSAIRDAVKGKTVSEVQEARSSMGFSVRDLVVATVSMVKESAYYRPVMELDPTALEQARKVDEGSSSGPLAGIVILVKGNIAVNGLRNDAGSGALADRVANADAPIVARLREAGAVILGRANLSELANHMSEDAPNGFSAMGGQTLSPKGPLTVDPLGSSTGSAVAVELGIVPLALGTETAGSIISPAQTAGVAGYRTGSQHWPRDGIIPLDSVWDAPGVLSRDIQSAIYAEQAISATAGTKLSAGVIVGLTADRVAETEKTMQAAGIRAVSPDAELQKAMQKADEMLATSNLLDCELATSLNPYLAASPGKVRSVQDLAEWYSTNPRLAPYGYTHVKRSSDAGVSSQTCEKDHAVAAAAVDEVGENLRRLGADFLIGSDITTTFPVMNGSPRVTLPGGKDALVLAGTSSAGASDLLATALALSP